MTIQQHAVLVADRSTKALATVLAGLNKVVTDLNTGAAELIVVNEQIEDRRAALLKLEEDLALATRRHKVELDVQVSENSHRVLASLQESFEMAHISKADLRAKDAMILGLQVDNSEAVHSAVQAAIRAKDADHNLKMLAKDSEHAVATAQSTAKIETLVSQNQFMAAQVAQLQGQIDAERAARQAIAEADARRQGVQVNTGK